MHINARFADLVEERRAGEHQFVAPYPSKAKRLVWLDVGKVDRSWSTDRGFYIGRGGTGNTISDRYARFGEWLKRGEPIRAPDIGLGPSGEVRFGDGRHRFSVLRDRGVQRMPFYIDRFDAEKARRKFGAG